jgi:YidC/Oxa1 family membrane protein insertase
MDKRFLLALVLTAVVVIATPWLFGTQSTPTKRAASSAITLPDSVARPPATPSSTPTPEAMGSRDSAAIPAGASRAGTADTSVAVAPARAESTVVATPVADYLFTNVGARPLSVELKTYRALDGSKRNVTLTSAAGRLLSYRLFLSGDTIDLSRVTFQLERSRTSANADLLTYRASVSGADVAIRYSFVPDSYLVRVSGEVKHPSATGGFIGVEMPTNLQSAEADSLDDQQHLAYAVKPQRENARGIPFSKLDPGERRLESGPITWAAAKNKYFIVGLLTATGDAPFAEVSVTGGPRTGRRATRAAAVVVEPISNGSFAFELYTGPQEWRRLLALGRDFENSNPYGGFLQGVVQPFATIVMRILLWMRATLNLGYGWVLVIFGVVVRLLLWPLNQKAMRTSMKMSRLQPELSEIQKRYKADPQRMQSEIMRVYREHGMSPFSSLSGCLPMLLPMPILFALFFVFQNTIEFRGVPFLWLSDISLKDPLYIVPVLMGLSMFALSIIGMRNSPPNPQAKMMAYVLPVMMTVFFLNLASGLNLYYAVQNITAIPQQWWIANERAKNTGAQKSG